METFADKTLNCMECGGEFVFSKSEQAFYAERGFTNEPKRSKGCRDKRKQRSNAGTDDHHLLCNLRAEVWNEHETAQRRAENRADRSESTASFSTGRASRTEAK